LVKRFVAVAEVEVELKILIERVPAFENTFRPLLSINNERSFEYVDETFKK
jgi:hypothetical protein